ncbi:MAG: hypothetical protein JO100_12965 [Pseudonocardia sp.]|nr:hypothetical protein [Pseudonocardia sp.]
MTVVNAVLGLQREPRWAREVCKLPRPHELFPRRPTGYAWDGRLDRARDE